MKNQSEWRPTRFEIRDGRLHANRSGPARSLFVTELLAGAYDRALREHAHGRLLDLGCGAAPLYGLYRDYTASSVCVDWSESAHGGLHVDIPHDLNQPLPFTEQCMDTVLLSDVLEHIYRPQELLGEVSRILAPGGCVILGTPFMYPVHEAPHDYHRFTEYCLRRMLAEHGMQVVGVERVGGALDVFTDVGLKLIAGASETLCRWTTRVASRALDLAPARRVRDRTSHVMTLAYVVVATK